MRKLPKLLVISNLDSWHAEAFYPQNNLRDHKEYWELYMKRHPNLCLDYNQSKTETALMVASTQKLVWMDISSNPQQETHKSGILFLPKNPSDSLLSTLFLLKDCLQELAFLELVYNIIEKDGTYRYQSMIGISQKGKKSTDVIDLFYEKYYSKESHPIKQKIS